MTVKVDAREKEQASNQILSSCRPYLPAQDRQRYHMAMHTRPGTDAFAAYLTYREELASVLLGTDAEASSINEQAAAHLDGLPYQRLRQGIPVEVRRSYSTFFTSSALRTRLVAPYQNLVSTGAAVLDPACGAGDLLLAAIGALPRTWTAAKLRRHVAARFHGRELVPVLAEVARDRLQLAVAMVTHSGYPPTTISLPKVRAGDGLGADVEYARAELVLLNPPYGRVVLPQSEDWGEGLTSEAAPFTLGVLRRCQAGTYVAAILPDVLRSGSRYRKWRDQVEKVADVEQVEVIGLFDAWTDIDVFIMHMRVRAWQGAPRAGRSNAWCGDLHAEPSAVALADVADVSVGDVVPHRHPEAGPSVPYLSVHSAPIGATVRSAPTRRFAGRLHQAPFVAVRRTSAPTRGRGSRIATSIVDGQLGLVAVENHLIVVKPRVDGIEACLQLSKQLTHPSVTAWLEGRLRTRHLTKQAMLEIPMPTRDVE